jgi:hypothetical protein
MLFLWLVLIVLSLVLELAAAREARAAGDRRWFWFILSFPVGGPAWYLWASRRGKNQTEGKRDISPWP